MGNCPRVGPARQPAREKPGALNRWGRALDGPARGATRTNQSANGPRGNTRVELLQPKHANKLEQCFSRVPSQPLPVTTTASSSNTTTTDSAEYHNQRGARAPRPSRVRKAFCRRTSRRRSTSLSALIRQIPAVFRRTFPQPTVLPWLSSRGLASGSRCKTAIRPTSIRC